MVSEILASFRQAHQTIRSNLVLVWFPPLFSLTLAVLLVLFAVVILQLLPDFGTGALLAYAIPTGSILIFVVIGTIVAVAAVNAGTMYQQALAVKGEMVDAGHFLFGAKKLLWRILAGSLLGYLWYGALTLALGWPFFVDFVRAATIGGAYTALPNEQIEAIVLAHAGRLTAGGLLIVLSAVLLSMWARALAYGDLSLSQALRRGLSFAFRRFLFIGGVMLLQWSGNLLFSELMGDVLWLVTALATHVGSVYVSVALMQYYGRGEFASKGGEAALGLDGGRV